MSGLFNRLDFTPSTGPREPNVLPVGDVPKELDIFYRDEQSFLPEGKTYEDLTPEELRIVKDKYRFAYMRPGIYQTLTGFSNMI